MLVSGTRGQWGVSSEVDSHRLVVLKGGNATVLGIRFITNILDDVFHSQRAVKKVL